MSKEIKKEWAKPASPFLYPLPRVSETWYEFAISLGLNTDEVFAVLLAYQASQGNLGDVHHLLKFKDSVNAKTPDRLGNFRGRTALHCAKDAAMVAYLVYKGANLNSLDAEGKTPLMWAILNNNPEVVAKLLELDANLDILNSKKDTAQSIAARMAQVAIAVKTQVAMLEKWVKMLRCYFIELQNLKIILQTGLVQTQQILADILSKIKEISACIHRFLPYRSMGEEKILSTLRLQISEINRATISLDQSRLSLDEKFLSTIRSQILSASKNQTSQGRSVGGVAFLPVAVISPKSEVNTPTNPSSPLTTLTSQFSDLNDFTHQHSGPIIIPYLMFSKVAESQASVAGNAAIESMSGFILREMISKQGQIEFLSRRFPITQIPALIDHYQCQREQSANCSGFWYKEKEKNKKRKLAEGENVRQLQPSRKK